MGESVHFVRFAPLNGSQTASGSWCTASVTLLKVMPVNSPDKVPLLSVPLVLKVGTATPCVLQRLPQATKLLIVGDLVLPQPVEGGREGENMRKQRAGMGEWWSLTFTGLATRLHDRL